MKFLILVTLWFVCELIKWLFYQFEMKLKIIFFISCFIVCSTVFSQIISGTIYDETTRDLMPGASVYLDGTNIGTVSDLHGKFELEISNSKGSSLIISYLGYAPVLIHPAEIKNRSEIYMQKGSYQLKEVVLEPDGYSRAEKLRIFKSEFLGKTTVAKHCKILNEKDITLIYSKSNKTLVAYSENPILITNKYLGYNIQYDMVDFEVEFRTNSKGLDHPSKVYIAGTSFFKNLNGSTKKRIVKHRKKEYLGSLVHFMRSLALKQLDENKFKIFYMGLNATPYQYFNISQEGYQTKVEITTKPLIVLYNDSRQSSINFASDNYNSFYIYENGNHSPPNSLLFEGDFAYKRISNILPFNYFPEN